MHFLLNISIQTVDILRDIMVRQEVFRGINAICTWYESSSKTTGMWTLGHGNWFVILHNFGYGVIVLATGFLRLGPLSLLLFGASFELAKKKKKKMQGLRLPAEEP